MDDTLVWAKEIAQKYVDGIVSVKVEPDEKETDFLSNSLNPENVTSMKQEKCEDVKFNFITNYMVGEEIETDSNPKEHKQSKKKETFECDLCTKSYKNAEGLNKHNKSVHEGVRYQCDQCDIKEFSSTNGLKLHINNIHLKIEEQFACDLCAKTFKQAQTLKHHIRSFHEGLRVQCDQCEDKWYSGPRALKKGGDQGSPTLTNLH